MNAKAQEFLKSKKIEHFNNEPGDHGTMGKIERFNRTVKQRLTKMSPKRITQKLVTHNQAEAEKMENEPDLGRNVRYRFKKLTIDKEAARWSKAVYAIVGMDGYRVEIRSKNGHTLYKSPND
ncbi:unnamed protein product [Phytophthora lilii]|uniref:Unnamed protein product n=1 Tax=Phytophthora lilii TaxID=2077276 RepID=A0A9W6X511_9STRA|nr:unnamed protein product [Phytophthora lilii]